MTERGDIVLVTGATGNTGGAAVGALVRRGVPVRAMVRSEADQAKLPDGVQAVIADFDDPASIAAALAGAGRAYLVTPSSERAEEQQRRFCDLAAEAGIRHLVVLSQLGADEHSQVRFLRYHAAVEQHVRGLGISYTFLRPNLFFQGLLAFARPIAAEGQFYAPIGDARVSAVDVRDIGAVAAVALTEPGHEGATYTLTGPAALTHAQIAEALTAALGRQVTFVDVPPSAFADSLRGVLPPWQVDGLLEDYAHYRRGEAAAVSSAVTEITGTPPRDVAQFAREYAPAFSGLSHSSCRRVTRSGVMTSSPGSGKLTVCASLRSDVAAASGHAARRWPAGNWGGAWVPRDQLTARGAQAGAAGAGAGE